MTKQQKLWTLLTILSTFLWGVSGLFAKFIFELEPRLTPLLLSQIRMLGGGLVLLALASYKKEAPLALWQNKRSAKTAIAYGLGGIIPVQFCYFMAIKLGDASIATILQFVGPFFIILYLAVFQKQRPRRIELISALVAFLGVALLATHGDLTQLAITPAVLIWGLLSAVGGAANTLIPRSLLKHYSSTAVTGWGLLIAGIGLTVIHPKFESFPLTLELVLLVLAVVVLGTIIPFQLFTNALKYIRPTTASMLDAFEPIAATIGSIIFFGLQLSGADLLGSFLVIIAVLALNWRPKNKKFTNKV